MVSSPDKIENMVIVTANDWFFASIYGEFKRLE